MNARSRTSAVLAAVLLASVSAAQAQSFHGRGPVEVSVVDRDAGYELPQYRHRGDTWVPGTPGHRYAVRLTNHSPERVLVVLSVDGVNAISGQTAHPEQGGYVLEPWQTTEVAGWRKSMRDVAQFYFSDLPDSYAARTGRPHDVGVIGVAVFEEARWHPVPPRYPRMAGSAAEPVEEAGPPTADAPAAAAAPPMSEARAQGLGTGHGRREYAPVSRTGFRRASSRPVQIMQLRYDDEYALASRGIVPRYRNRWHDQPRAFPGGFVPDPPRGWR